MPSCKIVVQIEAENVHDTVDRPEDSGMKIKHDLEHCTEKNGRDRGGYGQYEQHHIFRGQIDEIELLRVHFVPYIARRGSLQLCQDQQRVHEPIDSPISSGHKEREGANQDAKVSLFGPISEESRDGDRAGNDDKCT